MCRWKYLIVSVKGRGWQTMAVQTRLLFLQMKFYWNTAILIGLLIVYGYFHTVRTEWSRCIRERTSCGPQNL